MRFDADRRHGDAGGPTINYHMGMALFRAGKRQEVRETIKRL
jgi:hypothetical protein